MKQLKLLHYSIRAIYSALILVGVYLIKQDLVVLGIILILSCLLQVWHFNNVYQTTKKQYESD